MKRIWLVLTCITAVVTGCGGTPAASTAAGTTTRGAASGGPPASAPTSVGAGSTGDGAASRAPEPSAPPGHVSFMVFGDPAEKAAYDALVDAFRAGHPQITVELVHIPGQSDYRQRLAADFAAGTPADVVLLNYRRYAAFASKGVLEPLDPYLQRSGVIKEADFFTESMTPFRLGGALHCIPQNLSSLVVYYNKHLFDEASVPYPTAEWTWDDFVRIAKALTKDADGDGTPEQYGLGTEASIFRAAPFIWQNGGELVDDPALPTALTLDRPAAREALQWFADLQVKHKVAPDRVQEQAQDSESRFQAGTTAMFLNSRRGVPTYREITEFDWDVAPLPRGKQRAGILHADGYCMAKTAKDKDAVWAFIEYANSAEGQRIIAASGRTVPSLRAVAESEAFLDPTAKPANSRIFLDGIPYIRAVPIMATWVQIEEEVGEEIERAFFGEITVDQLLVEVQKDTPEFFGGEEEEE